MVGGVKAVFIAMLALIVAVGCKTTSKRIHETSAKKNPRLDLNRSPFPKATPQSQGIPDGVLDRLGDLVSGFVKAEEIVGAELLVIKNRRTVMHDVFGHDDRRGDKAMVKNTIFSIRSMTKPLTGAVAQMLIDDGALKLADPVAKYLDFFDNKQVLDRYYSYCSDFIRDRTGAKSVFAFDHNIRSVSGKKSKKMINGGQQVQGPAHIVHGDYTLTSAPERFGQLAKPAGKNDTLRLLLGKSNSLLSQDTVDETLSNGRFAIINLWRNIVEEPVELNPLALCDASTVSSQDLVVFEIHYADRIGENYFAKHNKKHKWYYFNKITKDEALLIKQWDSNGTIAKTNGKLSDNESIDNPCTFSFHSAFEDPATRDDAPDRWSIEVRCIVIY